METDKITNFDEQQQKINTLNTDFKAEVIAAGLIREGCDPERTIIVRKGADKRGYSKEVENVHAEFSLHTRTDYLHINAIRRSIYDILPKGLFHGASSGKKQTKADILQEFRMHHQEEVAARHFFSPFEITLDRLLVDAQLYEDKLDRKNINRNLVQIFIPYWPVIQLLPLKQAVLFLHSIPLMREAINDFTTSSRIMSAIMDLPIHIRREKKTTVKKNAASFPGLGESGLGVDWIIGEQCEDGNYNIEIKIGPIPATKIEYLDANATGGKILDALIKLLIPCDKETELKYSVRQEDARFILSTGKQSSYLGINTCL